ncbi:Gfo/Idh/MocA family oxidoreductase [Kaistia dalseonensis]|uniref:Dehydrogenase n=1 Tax=Kaistia dalseonensis TaxID=410840 RepID=A0ABU0HD22_9HYPH|nr:Gfo/Idh/MocA family oxidoreductase [Kaistia dalseonensis]MCX5497019.1 Gfo/Idh/MocA family oxidoreductase [Kaistia dalseonensis]MDQ0439645.1 putative dehydrogenase [Kaistia dalseonensis]
MPGWGILGTSFISDTVAKAIGQSPGSRIAAVAGRDAARTEAFRARFAIPAAYTDFDALLADPSVDIVYVGLPNNLHHVWTIRAAATGKPVLSEKSLSIDMEKSHALVDAVRAHDSFFVEGLMYLAHPVIARFVEILRDGRLGAVKSIHASYAADIWQLVNPEGRGVLYNLGCYPVSLLHLAIQTVAGEGAFRDRAGTGLGTISAHDGNVSEAAIALRFGNGILATVQTAETHGMHPEFTVIGEKGSLSFVTNPWLPVAGSNRLVWTGFDGSSEVIEVQSDGDAFLHQVRMVERSLAAGLKQAERPSPRLDDSIEIMELLTQWEADVRRG